MDIQSIKTLTIEETHKEIDLIQGCISRMANNSFMCKGWLLSLLVAILALLTSNISRLNICLLMLAVVLCFWWLDSFYLLQEKLYRFKYEWVIKNRPINLDYLYDLNPYNSNMWLTNYSPKDRTFIIKYLRKIGRKFTEIFFIGNKSDRPYLIEVMFSKTMFPMYGCCCITLILLIIFRYI